MNIYFNISLVLFINISKTVPTIYVKNNNTKNIIVFKLKISSFLKLVLRNRKICILYVHEPVFVLRNVLAYSSNIRDIGTSHHKNICIPGMPVRR